MKRKSASACDLLVCIYTCEKHRPQLRQFHESVLGRYFRDLVGSRVLEVYASPHVPRSILQDSELILRAEEQYDALSLKTLEMMAFCVRHFDFWFLVKIDVTTVLTRLDGPEYEGRTPIDLDELLRFLQKTPHEKDYDGFKLHDGASREGAEGWAAKKGKTINYEKLFGDGVMPPYFSGKCYIVSRRFAHYISRHGREMAEEHVKHFLGSEDVLIGRLYRDFERTLP